MFLKELSEVNSRFQSTRTPSNSPHPPKKVERQEEKKVKMALMMSFDWAQRPPKDKLKILLSSGRQWTDDVSSSKLSQKPLHSCSWFTL